ncbi:hypothetical protein Poly30_50430 [Planctomycetes bacterium Poly30]|uniref:Uncharacterized protein n=1 Tax=Saltatorellus ferox TaxID=2528018 RepID=A0A518EZG7_9BACT|nr:hypothetical protein Poly30_50430 [Planctomycetes bacterium Poly30]
MLVCPFALALFPMLLPAPAVPPPAGPQIQCGARDPLPLDLIDNIGATPSPFDFGDVKVGDQVLAALSFSEAPPGGGNPGAIYVYRQDAAGHWTEDARLFASDLGVSRFQKFSGAWFSYAISGDTLLVPTITGHHYEIAVVEPSAGGWSVTQRLQGDPSWHLGSASNTGYGSSVWLAADENRLVVGLQYAALIAGAEPGLIQTLERDSTGAWVQVNVTEAPGSYRSDGLRADLAGDRLALIRSEPTAFPYDYRVTVFTFGPTGWTSSWVSDPAHYLDASTSVSMDGSRVLVGSYYSALTTVYDTALPRLAASGSVSPGAPVQIISPPARPAQPPVGFVGSRDYNPPYDAFVEGGDGFALIGIGDDYPGFATVSVLEWFDGAYRLTDMTRAPAGVSDVGLFEGKAAWLGVAAPDAFLPPTEARFESWRIDQGRALPFCPRDSDLVVSGSGTAPLQAATLTVYGAPAGSLLTLFGGRDAGSTPASMGIALCIDPAGGLFRLTSPTIVPQDSTLRLPSSGLLFSAFAAPLLPGDSIVLQGVHSAAGSLGATNAVRVTLCD